MADPPVSNFAFFLDVFRGMMGLALGRLYTKLNPPFTDLTGKVAIVTGSNSGIGFQIALELAKQNATVYLACRNQSRADDAVFDIKSNVPGSSDRLKTLSLDTSSLSSIRKFVQTWEKIGSEIDIFAHNAGIASAPSEQQFNAEGFPIVYFTNFLGSYILTQSLEKYLAETARIVLTSSSGQYEGRFSNSFSLTSVKGYIENGFHAPAEWSKDNKIYSNTKAMQVCFAKLLQERWDRIAKAEGKKPTKTAHSFTPGFTSTAIFGKVPAKQLKETPLYWMLKATKNWLATDASQGAATGVWLATTDDEEVIGEGKGGGYWERMSRRLSKADFISREKLERLWVRWEADTGKEWR